MFTDSHCHLNFPDFKDRMPEVLAAMRDAQVTRALCICTTLEEFEDVHALAREHDHLWATVGVHPDNEGVREPTLDDLLAGLERLGAPALLKTRRDGYDGKGQVWIHAIEDAPAALESLGGRPAILEAKATFVRELSVIAARDWDGHMAVYPLGENRHEGGVLRTTLAPAAVDEKTQARARAIAEASLNVAGDICIYTNRNLVIEEL